MPTGGSAAGDRDAPRPRLRHPGHPRTKEWAYAGLVFVYGGAAASHLAAGDGYDKSAMPLFFVAATFAARGWLPQGASTAATLRALGTTGHRPQTRPARRQHPPDDPARREPARRRGGRGMDRRGSDLARRPPISATPNASRSLWSKPSCNRQRTGSGCPMSSTPSPPNTTTTKRWPLSPWPSAR
ncbi:DoxX family protein [Nocardia gamkensis]|uniref:DoxX family protein n=1 Tax=Nocardia gamkensis TaxID=352869 RepID=UPI001FDF336C|nr:DoxX family protein [Nocardia gamkensis]